MPSGVVPLLKKGTIMDPRGRTSMIADEIRPNRFSEVIGNREPVERITNAIANDRVPPVVFVTGPTGVGKTTFGRIVARAKICKDRKPGEFEPCGHCANCRVILDDFLCGLDIYEEIDANELTHERLFEWRHLAIKPEMVLFIDEVQDLEPSQMRKLRKMIEGLRATMILTTTHRDELEDALLNRLKSYEYRLARPTADDVVEFLERRCRELGVQFSDQSQLARVAEALNCEMRPCAEFPRKVLAETSDQRISDSYLDHVFGNAGASQPHTRQRRRQVI